MNTTTDTASDTAGAVSSGGDKPLRGKVALVTGGSRGIGRATALALMDAGANVAINYRSHEDDARNAASHGEEAHVSTRSFQADVSKEDEAVDMVERVLKEFERIDILVNNAGITRDKSFAKMTRNMWDEVLGVNLNGPFNVTHAVLPGMVSSGWGRVINIASIVGQTGNFGQANYAVTKGGLIAFTMTLAREVARKNVTVNAVAPGFIETDMTAGMPEQALVAMKQMIPMGRLGTAEEIAPVITFLAGPRSSYVTGQVIAINGGLYM